MAVAISYTVPSEPSFLPPDFLPPDFLPHEFVLADDQALSDALDIVLEAKRKNLNSSQKHSLLEMIASVTGGYTVGSLRAISKCEWRNLNIPLICRIYLKYLIEHSCNLTFKQVLECDFNYGNNLDWLQFNKQMKSLQNMGFDDEELILEAILVSSANINQAIEFLMLPPSKKQMYRERMKKKQQKYVPPHQHWTLLEKQRQIEEKNPENAWKKMDENQLKLEIERMQQQLHEEKIQISEIENAIRSEDHNRELKLYKKFLSGLLVGKNINPSKQSVLERYRRLHQICDDDHIQVLSEIGVTLDKFNKYKTFEDQEKNIANIQCIICYENNRNHIVIP